MKAPIEDMTNLQKLIYESYRHLLDTEPDGGHFKEVLKANFEDEDIYDVLENIEQSIKCGDNGAQIDNLVFQYGFAGLLLCVSEDERNALCAWAYS